MASNEVTRASVYIEIFQMEEWISQPYEPIIYCCLSLRW